MSICLSFCVYVCLSVYLSICPSVCLKLKISAIRLYSSEYVPTGPGFMPFSWEWDTEIPSLDNYFFTFYLLNLKQKKIGLIQPNLYFLGARGEAASSCIQLQMCSHTHKHIDRHTDTNTHTHRRTQTQTHTHRRTQTQTHTDRQTHTLTCTTRLIKIQPVVVTRMTTYIKVKHQTV